MHINALTSAVAQLQKTVRLRVYELLVLVLVI